MGSRRQPRGYVGHRPSMGGIANMFGFSGIEGGYTSGEELDIQGPTQSGAPVGRVSAKGNFKRYQVKNPTLDAIFGRGQGASEANNLNAQADFLQMQADKARELAAFQAENERGNIGVRGEEDRKTEGVRGEESRKTEGLRGKNTIDNTKEAGNQDRLTEGVRGQNELSQISAKGGEDRLTEGVRGDYTIKNTQAQGNESRKTAKATAKQNRKTKRVESEEDRKTTNNEADTKLVTSKGLLSSRKDDFDSISFPTASRRLFHEGAAQASNAENMSQIAKSDEYAEATRQGALAQQLAPIADNINKTHKVINANDMLFAPIGDANSATNRPYIQQGNIMDEDIVETGGVDVDGQKIGAKVTSKRRVRPSSLTAAQEEADRQALAELELLRQKREAAILRSQGAMR